ncbi:hypothetical protein D9757_000681 [Collybiopsis confluens]|uniref:Cation efflux protein transmembrane domain-containing protein n=1 Tax=Collybiopsis confluens TaxID=2823264 RepID=A0A8H5I1B4_9AGAR|nr:hypothetical protein D9757_000681 [Collybiopsis confluens]
MSIPSPTSPRPPSIEPPPRFFLSYESNSSYPTRSRTLQQLIESPPVLSRSSRSMSFSNEQQTAEEGLDAAEGTLKQRRRSSGAAALQTPEMRSMRLIGRRQVRFNWEKYLKSSEELAATRNRQVREYYERNNELVKEYIYIDRLLESSLPHELIQQYDHLPDIPEVASEVSGGSPDGVTSKAAKRTAKDIYRIPDERTALLSGQERTEDEDDNDESRIVIVAIYINLAANTVLLVGKIIITLLTSSLSVLASLVDSVLDFLSTVIVWITTHLIRSSAKDKYGYPVGRRRLEPVGVLVFSVIMVTSFFQVLLESANRLIGDDHSIVRLTNSAVIIMATTVVVKLACWLWCRLVKNSSVQALAQDAMTDVVFNIFSIIFPLVGYYLSVWWLDPLGGLLLSLYVIINWSRTSTQHIRNLSGKTASPADHSILLYLTMRFASSIKQIQGLQAYHAGDKLNVEVDIVCDEGLRLRESHDLGESLQYVLESVPMVERAFVHLDYRGWNLPGHLEQEG